MDTIPFAFVSYRRSDSSAASRWLANSIARTFGAERVFIDTESIRMSQDWMQRIDDALSMATVLIPVIGPHWLSSVDDAFRRRIDGPDDWVHREIAQALQSKRRILPILLSRTPMPRADQLPPALAGLARHQAFELRDERWESDLATLLSGLESFGFCRASSDVIRYPSPMVTLRELTTAELREALQRLPGWRCLRSDMSGAPGRQRNELCRAFEFASFEDAIAYMGAAVPKIVDLQHHPRWENLWRTVSVGLSTWDIGSQPSEFDLALALHLDELRGRFAPPKARAR